MRLQRQPNYYPLNSRLWNREKLMQSRERVRKWVVGSRRRSWADGGRWGGQGRRQNPYKYDSPSRDVNCGEWREQGVKMGGPFLSLVIQHRPRFIKSYFALWRANHREVDFPASEAGRVGFVPTVNQISRDFKLVSRWWRHRAPCVDLTSSSSIMRNLNCNE